VNRVGLGRHGLIEENAGDPLEGLVNLFDIGMVLAVAFLITGLGLALDLKSEGTSEPSGQSGRILPNPTGGPSASGPGEPVGQVYRLPDGRLIYVKRGGTSR
jgi:hypothetical protein